MISFADLSVADHRRSAQGRVHFINADRHGARGRWLLCHLDNIALITHRPHRRLVLTVSPFLAPWSAQLASLPRACEPRATGLPSLWHNICITWRGGDQRGRSAVWTPGPLNPLPAEGQRPLPQGFRAVASQRGSGGSRGQAQGSLLTKACRSVAWCHARLGHRVADHVQPQDADMAMEHYHGRLYNNGTTC
jgi:hypothetical protein